MKDLKELIQEKLVISKDTKQQKKSPYFESDKRKEYIDAINKKINRFGYKAINKNDRAIWVFPYNTQRRSMTLKNLTCAVCSKTHIEWGPNEKLKPLLEEPIFNAIEEIE